VLYWYVSPSLQLLLGVWVFREPFNRERLLGFVLIGSALVLVSLDAWRNNKRA
jgi:chloramphenicol-sensitive protein RarD